MRVLDGAEAVGGLCAPSRPKGSTISLETGDPMAACKTECGMGRLGGGLRGRTEERKGCTTLPVEALSWARE